MVLFDLVFSCYFGCLRLDDDFAIFAILGFGLVVLVGLVYVVA